MVLRHKGYGVYITCDGQRLAEYNIQIEDPLTISCYVPSEKGKTFVIHWEDDKHPENTSPQHGPLAKSIHVFMDSSTCIAAHLSQPGLPGSCDGSPVGNIGIRPFEFASIITTDDDALAAQNDVRHEKLGTIEVKMRRTLPGYAPPIGPAHYSHQDSGPVHERSKKAGAHRVGFGELQMRPQTYVSPNYFDTTYCATFRFYYRSADLLQAQGIMPPVTPPPDDVSHSPSSSKGVKREREEDETGTITISDNDSDDEAQLKRELKSIQDRISRKRARKSDIKAKREPGLAAAGQVGDVIDLT